VIASLNPAAASIRTHRSHQGDGLRAIPGSGLLISDAASSKAIQAPKPAIATLFPNHRALAETTKRGKSDETE
jgi:hypothetical protein